MDEQQREELRERNRRRAYNCSKCGSPEVIDQDGSYLSKDSHFAGVTYRTCSACGHEDVKRNRARADTCRLCGIRHRGGAQCDGNP